MGLIDRISKPIAKRAANDLLVDLNRMQKADSSSLIQPAMKAGVLRYTFDPVYVNSNYYNKKKPDSIISFDVLRNFSLKYEIVRACINLRKRQLSGMEWDIVTAETQDTHDYTSDILKVKQFFSQLCGTINDDGTITGGSYRKFMNMSIEDIMALDALSYYKLYNRAGELVTLIPVDGATIRLMIDGMGAPPQPPEIAYKQVIRGVVTGQYTTDEMFYTMMNPRTNSPYGLSPLESLMITVSSALKSGLYNLSYLTDGNIPEGLVNAPSTWSQSQIREFEANWNAALAGDGGATSKLHWLPADSKYVPTKKPADMAFEAFNMWLMQLTCSVYDVQPLDIGFPPPKGGLGGKGYSEGSKETSNDKGLRPVANLLEEIFNDIIQIDLNMPHLKFSFQGLDAENLRESAEVNEMLIFSGQRTINEIRTDDGLDAIEGGDALFIQGQFQPLNQEAVDIFGLTGHEDPEAAADKDKYGSEDSNDATASTRARAADAKAQADANKPQTDDADSAADNDPDMTASSKSTMHKTDQSFIQLVTEMRTLRKKVKNDFARGRAMKPFESNVLPPTALKEINFRLSKAKTFEEADAVIKDYKQDYQIEFLANVNKLRGGVEEILGDGQSTKTKISA